MTRAPSCVNTECMTGSGKPANVLVLLPLPSHSLGTRSRPARDQPAVVGEGDAERPAAMRAMFLISLPSCISNSFRLPSSLAVASTFESSRQLIVGDRRFVPVQIQVFAGRRGFPDEQPGAAVGRGQQHAVGAEFDGIDPIGVLPDFRRPVRAFAWKRCARSSAGRPSAISD